MKKRVERSYTDPSIVVTTYEGQHTHPCTVLPRGAMPSPGFGSGIGIRAGAGAASPFALPMQMANSNHFQMNYISSLVPHQLNHFGNLPSSNTSTNTNTNTSVVTSCSRLAPVSAALLRDHGLLQDIVPSIMKKEE